MRIVGAGFTRGEYLTGSGGQQLALRVSWGNRLGSANHGTGGCVRLGGWRGLSPFRTLFFHADRTVVITLKTVALRSMRTGRPYPSKSKAELGQMGVIKALESAWVQKQADFWK